MIPEQLAGLVRPLVWRDREYRLWASETVCGMLYIREYSGARLPFVLDVPWLIETNHPTLEAAKAAAQADYAARIIAALNLPALEALPRNLIVRWAASPKLSGNIVIRNLDRGSECDMVVFDRKDIAAVAFALLSLLGPEGCA